MEPILQLKNIRKTFPGVVALDKVELEIYSGEVHILLGENGAGKSTLMKILAGIYQPNQGHIFFEGKEIKKNNPKLSQQLGISTIYQELNLIPDLSVAENIFFGREPSKFGVINFLELHTQTTELLRRLNLSIDSTALVSQLSVAQQQMIEIAKALSFEAKVLTMDEPTSALSDRESETLFHLIGQLREKGVAIIYISHRFEELFRIGDRVTVLRDGKSIKTTFIKDTNQDELITWMVGRELKDIYPKHSTERGREKLRVKKLSDGHFVNNISFSLYAGEILGIAGLMGSGRTELLRLIFGADQLKSGEIFLDQKLVDIRSPKHAVKAGIGLLTEDRKHQGLVLEMSVRANTTLASLEKFVKLGWIDVSQEEIVAERLKVKLTIKTPSLEQKTGNLSGGNQQKVVIAKWLATQVNVLLFDEPTRGIDVGARSEIYELMHELLKEGMAIIMVSSDLPEVLGMSDRILVMANGQIQGEFKREEATQENILRCATLGKTA